MSLLRAEWRRFFARRFTRAMLLVTLALMAVVAIATAANSHRPTAEDRQSAALTLASVREKTQQELTECNQEQATGTGGFGKLPPGMTCQTMFGGPDTLDEHVFLTVPWTFATDGPNMILLFGGLMALLGFIVGASFIGVEWSSGGMMNLLLWRPGRFALLSGKLGALLLSVLASGLALGATWIAALCGIAVTRGRFGHMTSGVVASQALDGGRALALGLIASVIGFAIASLGRNTATALGVAIGYIILVEVAGRSLLALVNLARPERFFLSSYVAAWLAKTQHHAVFTCVQTDPSGDVTCTNHAWKITTGTAAEVIGVLAAIVVFWAYASFRRRDVT